MESWWDDGDSSDRYPVLTYAQLLLWPSDTTTGGVYVGQRYWVWPYTFWRGPAPYVPLRHHLVISRGAPGAHAGIASARTGATAAGARAGRRRAATRASTARAASSRPAT